MKRRNIHKWNRRHFLKNAAALCAAAAACDKSPLGSDIKITKLKSVTPSALTTPVNQTLEILFSAAIDAKSVNSDHFYLTDDSGNGAGDAGLSLSADKVTVNLPNMTPGIYHKFIIEKVVAADGQYVDLNDNGNIEQNEQYIYPFDKAVPPTVVSAVYNNPVSSLDDLILTSRFSRELDETSVTSDNVYIRDLGGGMLKGTVDYKVNDGKPEISLKRVKGLAKEKSYELVLSNIKDKWGFAIDGDGDGKIGGDKVYRFVTDIDDAPPEYEINVAGRLGVNVGTPIEIDFNEKITYESLDDLFTVEDENGNRVSGSWLEFNENEQIATFIPASVLDYETIYKIKVSKISDLVGNQSEEKTFSFTTEIMPSEQTPEPVEYLTAQTGISGLGRTILEWKIPSDKKPDGTAGSADDLLFDIFRSTSLINNEGDLAGAERVVENYRPHTGIGGVESLEVENPDLAKKYFYAIKVRDKDGNVQSQFTGSNGAISKGYTIVGRTTDGPTDGKFLHDGVKVTQGGNTFFSDSQGFRVEAGSLDDMLEFSGNVITTNVPYKINPSGENDIGDVHLMADDENIFHWCRNRYVASDNGRLIITGKVQLPKSPVKVAYVNVTGTDYDGSQYDKKKELNDTIDHLNEHFGHKITWQRVESGNSFDIPYSTGQEAAQIVEGFYRDRKYKENDFSGYDAIVIINPYETAAENGAYPADETGYTPDMYCILPTRRSISRNAVADIGQLYFASSWDAQSYDPEPELFNTTLFKGQTPEIRSDYQYSGYNDHIEVFMLNQIANMGVFSQFKEDKTISLGKREF